MLFRGMIITSALVSSNFIIDCVALWQPEVVCSTSDVISVSGFFTTVNKKKANGLQSHEQQHFKHFLFFSSKIVKPKKYIGHFKLRYDIATFQKITNIEVDTWVEIHQALLTLFSLLS